MTRRRGRKFAAYLAGRRAELGASAARRANLWTVMAAWSPTPADAAAWEAQARDLNALADRCGWRPTLNGAGHDD